MWLIDIFESATTTLDFKSSGQGWYQATTIRRGDTELINALELVHFDPDETQVRICEQCGTNGCDWGNWISIRRLALDWVVWLPVWPKLEAGGRSREKFSPPRFMVRRGTPCFTREAWDELRLLDADAPEIRSIPPVEPRDLARLVQWSAPEGVLGAAPSPPAIRRKIVLAVSVGELGSEADAVDRALDSLFSNQGKLEICKPVAKVEPIEFHLYLPRTPTWSPFVRWKGVIGLPLTDGANSGDNAGVDNPEYVLRLDS